MVSVDREIGNSLILVTSFNGTDEFCFAIWSRSQSSWILVLWLCFTHGFCPTKKSKLYLRRVRLTTVWLQCNFWLIALVDQPASLKLSMLAISTSLRCDVGSGSAKLHGSCGGGIPRKFGGGWGTCQLFIKVSPFTCTWLYTVELHMKKRLAFVREIWRFHSFLIMVSVNYSLINISISIPFHPLDGIIRSIINKASKATSLPAHNTHQKAVLYLYLFDVGDIEAFDSSWRL